MRYSHLLNTTDLQYAFKKGHSAVICTLVLKEVINYYLNNNSDVYTCFIDATNGQCGIIGFTLEEMENMMYDICVDWLILSYGAF